MYPDLSEEQQLIKCFDEVLDYVFGKSLGRDNPHKEDRATAAEWLKMGASIILCTIVFCEQMNWMHEKYLRNSDRKYIPHSLKIFNDNIAAAIRKQNGTCVEPWEAELSRWRSRFHGFKSKGYWNENLWGLPPNNPNTRIPASILNEA